MASRAEIAKRKAAAEKAWAYRIRKTYGITADEYNAIKEFQGGVCAMCRRAKGTTRRLSIDHDHRTGEVRGLLCSVCNNILGHFRDDQELLRDAASYLRYPPAFQVIGVRKVPTT